MNLEEKGIQVMNLEEIKNRCDNRYDKLRDAELDVEWLIDEVERLENLKYMGVNAEYVETNNQLRADMTKIKKLVESILVAHVEGREFMTSSQLHEAVIQDCTAALNVGR